METPVCLSKHFVNKQNVRSYSNIFSAKLLKNDNEGFLKHVLEDLSVSELPTQFIEILLKIRNKLKEKSKEEFKNYFSHIEKETNNLSAVSKTDVFNACTRALNDFLPRNFFGGKHNLKIFNKLIHIVIFSMKRQHFMFSKAIEKWDFGAQVSNFCNIEMAQKYLLKILLWIIKHVLSPMICLNFYVTTCKLDSDENKLHYFWKNQWQRFYDKKISNFIFTKILRRYSPYCLGKKVKRNLSLGERLKLKSLKKDIPKLHLVLKPNGDCRPIVRYKSNQTTTEKYKMKERLIFLKLLTGKQQNKIESHFNILYQKWVDLMKPKLYFIKTDLSNAFGSINKEKLMKILNDRYVKFQKNEKNMHLKQKMAQQYKEMVEELRKPLLVRAGNTVYEWREGLVQGYKYSPALSELYYTHLDELYFCHHLQDCKDSEIKFFSRVVDDYLYITDSLQNARSFLEALSSYRNVNYEKTTVNFEHESIKFSEEITFLGYSYNTGNLQVSRANNVFVGQMCYKIAFSSALGNLSKFLENRIGQSGIQINGHIFNFIYNSEELVWKHIFTTYCLSANKFCTILAVLCEQNEMNYYLNLYKKRVTVKLTNAIVYTLMKNKTTDFMFMYCINHFRYLSFKALYLCAKSTPKCSGLVPLIKDEMAKSNCLFGKWRDHSCRINSNGEMNREAIKPICRRTDLRKIVNHFDTLPIGVQCYNHKDLF